MRSFEYAKIVSLRPDAIELDNLGNPCLRKADGGCIFLEKGRFCGLQPHGLKPFACKIWPFNVYTMQIPGGVRKSEFPYRDKMYYVYLHPEAYICPGINKGRPEELTRTISEVIEICMNPLRRQFYSTCKSR